MAEQAALWGGLTMDATGSFPLSTDSILLADFAAPGSKDRVIDLGSSCGTLGLLLCGKTDGGLSFSRKPICPPWRTSGATAWRAA